MRSGAMALAVTFAAGLTLLAALALSHGSALVYTLGVQPQQPTASLQPGDRACQAPVRLPRGARFERVGFHAAGDASLELSLSEAGARRPLRRARVDLPPARGTAPPLTLVAVAAMHAEQPLAVCFVNRGGGPMELWGGADAASADTTSTVNDAPTGLDIAVVFEREHARSLVALAPEMAERASLFRARWLSPLAYAILAGVVLSAVPALLVVALRGARD